MAKRKDGSSFVETLQDPGMVGASEYRAVHELLKDVADGFSPDETSDKDQLKHLDCVLGEVLGWARRIRADLRKYRKGA